MHSLVVGTIKIYCTFFLFVLACLLTLLCAQQDIRGEEKNCLHCHTFLINALPISRDAVPEKHQQRLKYIPIFNRWQNRLNTSINRFLEHLKF